MEDVLTEIPPPSRFHEDELDNFARPWPPIPAPFLVFSNPKPEEPLRPSLCVVAVTSPSISILYGLHSKALLGSLVLPEIPLSGNSLEPSIRDKSCNIYALGDSVLLVSVQLPVAAERSHALAKLLIGERIIPERVVIFDSIQRQNFRAKLSPDDLLAFKLESSAQRKEAGGFVLEGLEYFPSGSVVDGLSAALLSRCEVKRIKGTLIVTWPEPAAHVVSIVKSILKSALSGSNLSFNIDTDNELLGPTHVKNHLIDTELYT